MVGGFAKGGRPPTGRPSLVGEEGPELFIPDQSGVIIPAHVTSSFLASPPQREVILGSAQSPQVNHRTELNLATFDSRQDAEKWANSQQGHTWFFDMMKRNGYKFR